MAIEDDIIGAHHFEAAGIPVDDVQDENKDEGKENKVDEANSESGSTSSEQKEKSEADPKPGADGANSGGDGANGDKKQEPAKEEKKPNRSEQELDQEGLQEAQTGETVRAGIAQRWLHQRDTARRERDATKDAFTRVQQEVETTRRELEAYKTSTAAISAIPPAEVPAAVKLYSALKSNPVAAIKSLLVEAKAAGHTIDGIGEGVDTAAIQRLIDQKLNLASEQNRGSQTQQERQEPKTVENDDELFFAAYPDAQIHSDVLVDMLNKNIADFKAGRAPRILTNTELYFTLRNAVDSNGLDFSKPLQPQIQAKQQQGQQQQGTHAKPDDKKADTPIRLNGRGAADVSEPLISTGGKEESFGDIVKRALAENPIS